LSKIIFFSSEYSPHDHRFLSALAETEHEVFYVRLQNSRRQTEDRPIPSSIQQVQWVGGQREFHWRDLPKLVFDFRRLTRKIRPDIVHAGPIQTCGMVATLAGSGPRLIMSWGFDLMQDAGRNAWWRWATRFVLQHATYFTSDCEVTRKKAIQYGMSQNRTVVFPWGVDLEHFSPSNAKVQSKNGFTLFCNRSWESRYGVDVLAKAFTIVACSRPDVNLLLLGDGSQRQVICKILNSSDVNNRVTYAGQVSQRDLPRYYQMANIYISPSHVDGSSVSLMEAMACGLPCLVSDIPANQEWITDGVNGWLFPDDDANALAGRILTILGNSEALGKIGLASRHVAEERADWKKNFQILLDTYELVLR
jgi:glycosyltransferase involved in cell wall biosynthesis